MGCTTDFVGHVDISPPLNEHEIEFLTAFHQSRRFDRPGGPYDVPGNPLAEENQAVSADVYNRVAHDQPSLWCDWTPCWDGCCLSFNGNEKFYAPVEWMRYLIEHFLAPGAHASASLLPVFEGFTFDHRLDGTVVGCRRDDKELFAIEVEANAVVKNVLRPGDPIYAGFPPLPYEVAKDEAQASSARQRRARNGRRREPAGGGSSPGT